jgi:hypothetical protein
LGPAEIVGPDRRLPEEAVNVRGRQGRFFFDGQRLELYTADAAIVIFWEGQGGDFATPAGRHKAKATLFRAAAALRRADTSAKGASVGSDLPPPVAGGVEDRLSC